MKIISISKTSIYHYHANSLYQVDSRILCLQNVFICHITDLSGFKSMIIVKNRMSFYFSQKNVFFKCAYLMHTLRVELETFSLKRFGYGKWKIRKICLLWCYSLGYIQVSFAI